MFRLTSSPTVGSSIAPGLSIDSIRERARWFCRVRWAAVVGHALVFLAAQWLLQMSLEIETVLLVETALIISNSALYLYIARIRSTVPLGIVLLLDIALLTALLSAYGGHMNPFSMVYLVQVVLAALFIGHAWTWVVAIASTLSFAGLFFLADSGALHQHHSAGSFDLHLQGMLVVFVLISFLIAGFVSRMRLAIDQQERELLNRKSNEERLAALTQLAAGAAHELGTPLGTMSVILTELLADGVSLPPEELKEELSCLKGQLERCSQILRRMAPEAGDIAGEMPSNRSATEVIERVSQILPPDYQSRLQASVEIEPGLLYLPIETVSQALASLVKNGLDASVAGSPVHLTISRSGDAVSFEVRDSGTGMDKSTLRKIGEPFYTTKEPGKGTGLGIFLCRLLASRLNGGLDFDSAPGEGTRARLKLPLRVVWGES